MLVGGGALHAPPALLRGAPPLFDYGRCGDLLGHFSLIDQYMGLQF